MQFLKHFILLVLNYGTSGKFGDKLSVYATLVSIQVPLLQLLNKYILGDFDVLIIAVTFLAIDIVSRIWADIKLNQLGLKMVEDLAVRFFIVATGYIITHQLGMMAGKYASFSANMLLLIGYSTVLVYVLLSLTKSLKVLSKGAFPPNWFTKRLEGFNETGDLKNQKDEESPNSN